MGAHAGRTLQKASATSKASCVAGTLWALTMLAPSATHRAAAAAVAWSRSAATFRPAQPGRAAPGGLAHTSPHTQHTRAAHASLRAPCWANPALLGHLTASYPPCALLAAITNLVVLNPSRDVAWSTAGLGDPRSGLWGRPTVQTHCYSFKVAGSARGG